jgi:GGDEF domain-containing protein
MEDESTKDKLGGIVPAHSEAIAKASTSLMGRGLRSLSGWDATRVIEAGKELTSSSSRDRILEIFAERLKEFLNPPFWSILFPYGDGELHFDAGVRKVKTSDMRLMGEMDIGFGVAGRVFETRSSIIISNVPQYIANGGLEELGGLDEPESDSIVAVPMCQGSTCIAVLELFDCVGPEGFPQADLALLEALADFAAIGIDNAHQRSCIESYATYNEYTKLHNARDLNLTLEDDIKNAVYYSDHLQAKGGYNWAQYSVVCIVSEEMKSLATSLSYAHYMVLLTALGHLFADKDRLPRFRGKEFYCGDGKFYVTLTSLPKERATVLARQIHKIFKETVWLKDQGLNVRLDASVGVATCPEDGRTKEELLQSVDEAVSLVKNSTGDGVAAAKIGILPPL